MKDKYFYIIMMAEKLHRLFLDILKKELEKNNMPDITGVQGMIIYNIGPNKISVGEISNRGYYLGSNVTYNLKKMIDHGYIEQVPSPHDKRSNHVLLTDKGTKIYNTVEALVEKHVNNMPDHNIKEDDLRQSHATLRSLEQFWAFVTPQ